MSVFRGSLEAGRHDSRAAMQITGVVAPMRCVSRRFRSFQVINRSRVQVDYLYHHLGAPLGEAEKGLYIPARKGNRTVRTERMGDYFARIAPSSQKAASLICLRSGDRGLPIITYDALSLSLLAAGAISPAATNHHEEAAAMGEESAAESRDGLVRAAARSHILLLLFVFLASSTFLSFSLLLSLHLPLLSFAFLCLPVTRCEYRIEDRMILW